MRTMLVAVLLVLGLVPPAAAATVTVACAAVGIEYRLCREGAEAWAARTGNAVELVQTPNLANERLALFQQLLAAGSPDIDVFQIDVIWPGILGRYFLPLDDRVPADERAGHFPAMLENDRVDGALVALPWYADAGLLYYRKDLLERHGVAVPETWDALAAAAETIVGAEGGAGRLVGYVFQGKAYEGLTCNALEWIASNGGALLAPDGTPTLDTPAAIAAVATAASWIGGIAPEGVLTYAEEEARGAFQAGQAVFMRNWPYAWALSQGTDSPVRGKVGVAVLPHGPGGPPAATLGGGGLAVSRFSRSPDAAVDLIRALTGPEEQLRRAVEGSFNPTRPALYDDPALRAANPFMAELRPVLEHAVARPATAAGSDYNRFSATVWNAVHAALSGERPAAESLAAAQRRLERLSRRRR